MGPDLHFGFPFKISRDAELPFVLTGAQLCQAYPLRTVLTQRTSISYSVGTWGGGGVGWRARGGGGGREGLKTDEPGDEEHV